MPKLLSQGNEREARDSVVAGKELEIWSWADLQLWADFTTEWLDDLGQVIYLSQPPFF